MTTLQSIGFTLAGGTAVGGVTMLAFAVAVAKRSIFIAPRATARPRNVIFNPNPTDSSQDRGNPMFGWMKWALSLTYDTMLSGVPGTGTREGGLSGSMLRVTLDGVFICRFHALCRRITLMMTFFCIVILLPCYYSAQCYRETGNLSGGATCNSLDYNLTNYDRTTIANVPPAEQVNLEEGGVLVRLYTTAFTFWIVLAYSMYLLNQEWIEVLAMRRVYYLERDVWGERRKELKETLLYDEKARNDSERQHFTSSDRDIDRAGRSHDIKHLVDREPWIPHPEQRDTVSNIELYSVLVGGLPSLPKESLGEIDPEAAVKYSQRERIDWQLSLATTIFDHAVPNMPGYSSSVVAVTVIPSAKDMTLAWKKWYTSAAKLRRLRFIRKEIQRRRQCEIEDFDGGLQQQGVEENSQSPNEQVHESGVHGQEVVSPEETKVAEEVTPRPIYKVLPNRASYFNQVFGSLVEEVDENVYQAILFGPEQAAVYSRELAQSASPCCPNGYREDRILKARIDELIQMEKDALTEVHQAYRELEAVRRQIAIAEPQPDVNLKEQQSEKDARSEQLSSRHGRLRTPQIKTDMPNELGLEADLYKKALDSQALLPPEHEYNAEEASRPADEKGQSASNRMSSSWALVEAIVSSGRSTTSTECTMSNGSWQWPTWTSTRNGVMRIVDAVKHWLKTQSVQAVDTLARHSTFAVVTFSSRQAAVAARNCVADGRGAGRWLSLIDVPTPPLADAAACDIMACRNACRPVTISINERQKSLRFYVALVMLFLIYVFYTVPLTFATNLASADNFKNLLPQAYSWAQSRGFDIAGLLSGFISALIYTLFFSFCPSMFKGIANFGSGAVSVAQAEYRALQYYWWFMLVTAFTGQLLVSMVLKGVEDGLNFESGVRSVIRSVSLAIPSTLSPTWLNWIIFRFTMTLPLNYLLQINTFIFYVLGWNCCSRVVRGGGPGGPTPYRVYVDGGVVFLCAIALGPASPLVSLASLVYFVIMEPLMRRNLIYVYRPKFDGGGVRWPFMFDMVISVFIFAEILLTAQMVLKQSIGPAIVCAVPILPTLMFSHRMKQKYLRPFQDAALLQTSLLDGWDTTNSSMEQREEFRQFLVDAHKAAYLPICIAGSDTDEFLTAEPAVVIPLESDPEVKMSPAMAKEEAEPQAMLEPSPREDLQRTILVPKKQHGAMLRRAVLTVARLRVRESQAETPADEGVALSLANENIGAAYLCKDE